MMTSVLLSRVMGLVREQVLAKFFGTSPEMNAYVASFIIPEFLNHLLAGGFLSITFIPIFQKYLVSNEKEKSWRVFSNLLTTGTIVLSVFVVLFMIFTKQFVGLLGHGAPTDLTIRLTRIIMPAQIMFYWGAFLMAVQYANHKFFLPAMLPLCYNGGIILGGVLLNRVCGIEGFAWGVLAGAFVGNILVQIPGALQVGLRFKPIVDIKDKDLRTYILLTLPLILGLGMTFSNEIFFRFFGSFLSSGALSSINYSLRTMMILVAVFGQAAGVASYPFLSRLAAENKFDEMNKMLNSITRRMAGFLIPCCGVALPLCAQIIAVLYQHGRFTAQSTAATAPVLAVYLIGAFPFAASTIVMRSFYAQQRMVFPMVTSTIIAIISIPLYIVFSSLLGAPGIALASSIAMIIQFTVLYVSWETGHGHKDDVVATGILIVKILVLTTAGSAVCLLLRNICIAHHFGHSFVSNVLILGIAGIPAMTIIAISQQWLGIIDLKPVFTKLTKRLPVKT